MVKKVFLSISICILTYNAVYADKPILSNNNNAIKNEKKSQIKKGFLHYEYNGQKIFRSEVKSIIKTKNDKTCNYYLEKSEDIGLASQIIGFPSCYIMLGGAISWMTTLDNQYKDNKKLWDTSMIVFTVGASGF